MTQDTIFHHEGPAKFMFSEDDSENLLALDEGLNRLSRSLTCDSHLAEDAKQEAWLAALGSKKHRKATVGGWLNRALRLRVLNLKSRETRHQRALEQSSQDQAEHLTPSQIMQKHEMRLQLMETVRSLKDPYRQTITLRFLEGLDTKKVALLMGVPEETVRTRTKRALSHLRRNLDQKFHNRMAWALPLMCGQSFSHKTAAIASGFVGKPSFSGVFIMSGKSKVAVVLGFVIALSSLALFLTQDQDPIGLIDNSGVEQADARHTVKRPIKPSIASSLESSESQETTDKPAGQTKNKKSTNPPLMGALHLKVIHEHTGLLAAHVPVRLIPFGVDNYAAKDKFLRTTDKGELILDPWPTGTTLALCSLGGNQRIKVDPGKTSQGLIKIPQGSRVVGLVTNQSGEPVPHADIYVCELYKPVQGPPVTTSDFEGFFEITNVSVELIGSIGARAKGYQPSAMSMVNHSVGNQVKLELQLGPPCENLKIKVQDSRGALVAGARVLVGENDYDQFDLKDGTKATHQAVFGGVTDQNGIIEIHSIKPGETRCVVRAPLFAPQNKLFTIQGTPNETIHLILDEGSLVQGTIKHANGENVSGARIVLGKFGALESHTTRSNQDGQYRLVNVANGEHSISVQTKGMNSIKGQLKVKKGETTTWDAAFEAVGRLKGILVDEHGVPVADLSVRALNLKTGAIATAGGKTDGSGEFLLEGLVPMVAHRISVCNGNTQVACQEQAIPKMGPIRIEVPRSSLGLGQIRGRIVDPNGIPLGGVNVVAVRNQQSNTHQTTNGEGQFEFGNLPPGSYALRINSPKHGYQSTESFRLEAKTVHDAGDVRFRAGGRLQVELFGPQHLLQADNLWILAESQDKKPTIRIKLNGRKTLSQPLAPGKYNMILFSPAVANNQKTVEIRSDQITSTRMKVEAGKRLDVLVFAAGNSPNRVRITLKNDQGEKLYDGSRTWVPNEPRNLFLYVPAAPTQLTITDQQGRTGILSLRANKQKEVRLELR